jgi:hypothetical protein
MPTLHIKTSEMKTIVHRACQEFECNHPVHVLAAWWGAMEFDVAFVPYILCHNDTFTVKLGLLLNGKLIRMEDEAGSIVMRASQLPQDKRRDVTQDLVNLMQLQMHPTDEESDNINMIANLCMTTMVNL